ncbi:C40 family peptidase [bacterium]|nr:C40 family peptidase [bacterium]
MKKILVSLLILGLFVVLGFIFVNPSKFVFSSSIITIVNQPSPNPYTPNNDPNNPNKVTIKFNITEGDYVTVYIVKSVTVNKSPYYYWIYCSSPSQYCPGNWYEEVAVAKDTTYYNPGTYSVSWDGYRSPYLRNPYTDLIQKGTYRFLLRASNHNINVVSNSFILNQFNYPTGIAYIRQGRTWIGTPYGLGGISHQFWYKGNNVHGSGAVDCSGFVLNVSFEMGFCLPDPNGTRNNYCQNIYWNIGGNYISRKTFYSDFRNLRQSNLLFFDWESDSTLDHVAIYTYTDASGDRWILHPWDYVIEEKLSYWRITKISGYGYLYAIGDTNNP